MAKSDRMPIKKYTILKEMLYTLTKQYEKERLINFFEKVKYNTVEEKEICINTILYPNDLQIIKSLFNILNEEEVSKQLEIPIHILREKGKEFGRYKTWNILKDNKEIIEVAATSSNMEVSECESFMKKLK